MTKQDSHEIADRIAAEHGCEILPGVRGQAALHVQDRYRQGDMLDAATIARCRAAIEAAGVNTSGWVSGVVTAPLDIIRDLPWTYDAALDVDGGGPPTTYDGYHRILYFDALEESYPSRGAAIEAIRAAYKGPDCCGVGLDIDAPVGDPSLATDLDVASDVNPLRVNDIVIWDGREWSVRMVLGRADGIGQDGRPNAPRALWATLAEYPRHEDSPLVERHVVYWRAEGEARQLGMTSTPIPDGEVYRTGRRLQVQNGRVIEVRS